VRQAWRVALLIALFQSLWWWLDDLEVRVHEAAVLGKEANIFKARYLHGKYGRKCSGYKCEGRTSYPGRSVNLPCATGIVRCRDGLAEVSRGHISRSDPPMKG